MGLKEAWFGKDPEIITKVVEDPYKIKVTNPLSNYLASEVGKGLPRYTGQIYEPLDTSTLNRYNEFMGLSASDLFNQAIGDPETRRFKEDLLPEITEGYAGSLRGSGRYRAEEAGINQFTESLISERAKFIPEITQAQISAGMAKAQYEDIRWQREYADWMKSLPEMNPILDKALAFLAGPTGRDVITAVDPGRQGWLKDLVQTSIDAIAALTGGSRTGSTAGQMGSVSGGGGVDMGGNTADSDVWKKSVAQPGTVG